MGLAGLSWQNIRIGFYILRLTISFLISAIAFAGLRPFGQVATQFMIVWQRYSLNVCGVCAPLNFGLRAAAM